MPEDFENNAENRETAIGDHVNEDLLHEPYFSDTARAHKKQRDISSMLRKLATAAAVLALAGVCAYYTLPSFFTSPAAGISPEESAAGHDSTTADTVLPETTTINSTVTTCASTRGTSGIKKTSGTDSLTKTFTTTGTFTSAKKTDGIVIERRTNSHYTFGTNSPMGPGFIRMSMAQIRSEIDKAVLHRYVNGETNSSPENNLSLDAFYDIMEIIKKYSWTEYNIPIHAYELNEDESCEISVSGHDTFYTTLVIGSDLKGKCLAYSNRDCKLALLSEKDFADIQGILRNAG